MDKLNEASEFLGKNPCLADCVVQITYSEMHEIAEAFRELEQRAESAEAQLAELARKEPDYFLNRIESSDKWGPETELRIYESQLDASKSKDDHGGGIIELFTRPAPAAAPTKDQIREVFMHNGFTVKEGQTDLKPYVYDAAYALLGISLAPDAYAKLRKDGE